jgi:DNA polymerase III subunit delta'
MDSLVLPWQQVHWDKFSHQVKEGRLPHALLFVGDLDATNHFARQLIASRLCLSSQKQANQQLACGVCQSCRLFSQGSYPDFHLIASSHDTEQIKIDQIRSLDKFLSTKPYLSHGKYVLIYAADLMNVNASNSLLKNLEEPPENTLIILLTDKPSSLPITISSRCQKTPFFAPAENSALSWIKQKTRGENDDLVLLLHLSAGNPLSAIKKMENDFLIKRKKWVNELNSVFLGKSHPILLAQSWSEKEGFGERLTWFCYLLADIIRIKAKSDTTALVNRDQKEWLMSLSKQCLFDDLYAFWSECLFALNHWKNQMNLQSLMENILIVWCGVVMGKTYRPVFKDLDLKRL